jgi:hypothetical protein
MRHYKTVLYSFISNIKVVTISVKMIEFATEIAPH